MTVSPTLPVAKVPAPIARRRPAGPAARPVPPAVVAASAALVPAPAARQAVPADDVAKMGPVARAWLALKLAAAMLPAALGQMWANKGQLLAGLVAPYLHPLRSLAAANKAVAAAWREDPLEAAIAVVKHHGALVAAWAMPVAIGLSFFTGGATMVATAGVWLGTAALAATGVSFAKNVVDAARSQTREQLVAQSEQLLQDGMGLGMAAATMGATKGAARVVRFVRGRWGPEQPVSRQPQPVDGHPEASYAEIQKKVGPVSERHMREAPLTHVPDAKSGGATPKHRFVDAEGNKFNLKMQPKDSLEPAIEQTVAGLREQAGVPTYRTVRRAATLADGSKVEGLLKLTGKSNGDLPADPAAWTPTARAAMMDQHPWQAWLADTDPHPMQYKLIGDKHFAFYGDVDHALMGFLEPGTLGGRHGQFMKILTGPEVLYKAFVEGKVDLDLGVMQRSAERIAAMPDAAVAARLKPFMDQAFAGGKGWGPFATREAFVQTMLQRKAALPGEFAALATKLSAERARNLGLGGPVPSWGEYLRTAALDLRVDALARFWWSPLYEPLTQLRQWLSARKA